MRKEIYKVSVMEDLFKRGRVATLDELKQILGTRVTMTVFRKLKLLSYVTSFSHKGKYYTLKRYARFNSAGLWSFQSIWFSKFGTLQETARVFVKESSAGYTASELSAIMHVDVKEGLLRLFRSNQLHRAKLAGSYVYFSLEGATRRRQQLFRQDKGLSKILGVDPQERESLEQLRAALVLFYSVLDEQQRRLFAGLESLKIGFGGDANIAAVFGLDAQTVSKGRQALLQGDVQKERVRQPGGGRKAVEKKRLES